MSRAARVIVTCVLSLLPLLPLEACSAGRPPAVAPLAGQPGAAATVTGAVTGAVTPPVPTPPVSPTPIASADPALPAEPAPSQRTVPPSVGGCVATAEGCLTSDRLARLVSYLRSQPARIRVVVRDRVTGTVWRDPHSTDMVWAASTTKLAMAVDLLLRDRAGTIRLTAADRDLIHRMLHVSDDSAASTLWDRYGAEDIFGRFATYGLASATFVTGFPRRWGYVKYSADDLDRLMRYVLEKLPAPLRDFVVGEMRTVGPNQRWGVWGAGAAARPGNKDGWTPGHESHWVLDSVGFAGPGERYTLAMMSDQPPGRTYDDGTESLSRVAALLFGQSTAG